VTLTFLRVARQATGISVKRYPIVGLAAVASTVGLGLIFAAGADGTSINARRESTQLQALANYVPNAKRGCVIDHNSLLALAARNPKVPATYPFEALDTLLDARNRVAESVRWYNHEHRHSAIRLVTPARRHTNFDKAS
jgi:hypothetical protein